MDHTYAIVSMDILEMDKIAQVNSELQGSEVMDDLFINPTIITYNLVSIYALLEIRAHFKRIKIVFINRTTITYNLVSIYTLLEIWATA